MTDVMIGIASASLNRARVPQSVAEEVHIGDGHIFVHCAYFVAALDQSADGEYLILALGPDGDEAAAFEAARQTTACRCQAWSHYVRALHHELYGALIYLYCR